NNNFDLSNCYITRKDSGDVEMFGTGDFLGKTINAHSYFLLSNYTGAGSKIGIEPNIFNIKMSLSNTNLQIKLFCNDVLIDTADDGSGIPLMGDNVNKKSMSRRLTPGDGTLAENWCTASTQVNWDDGATELGTPGAQNFC
ncbi:hypothetical protein COZ26_02030, partial [Candidatus Kuenenbacteria bacterium CG_4_10_14_3_um_filter_39_14]